MESIPTRQVMTFATILRNYDFPGLRIPYPGAILAKEGKSERERFIRAKAIFNYSKIANYSNSNMLTTSVFVTWAREFCIPTARGGGGPGAICAPSLAPFLMPEIEREWFFCSAKFFEKVKMIWRWKIHGESKRVCVSFVTMMSNNGKWTAFVNQPFVSR